MNVHVHHVLGFVALVALAGCDSSSSSDSSPAAPEVRTPTVAPSSQGPMSPEVASAATQTADAFQTLFRQDSGDADNPMGSKETTIRNANASLRSAWNANNADSRAAFGAAITGLALKFNEMAGTMARAQEDLGLGGRTTATGTTTLAYASPTSIATSMPVLARVVANPSRAPLLHELQDSIELLLLPTFEESIRLLEVAWSDSVFEFHVALDPENFPGDTLVIDRSDVGLALSILQAMRAQLRWLVSYNVDIDRGGSYAWAETLSHVKDMDSLTPAQRDAIAYLESIVSNESPLLKVRAGKEAILASVPLEFRTALARAREAAVLGYTLKAGRNDHLGTFRTIAVRDSFLRVVDSGIALLAGPRDFQMSTRMVCAEFVESSEGRVGYRDTLRWVEVLGQFRHWSALGQSVNRINYSWSHDPLSGFHCEDAAAEEYQYDGVVYRTSYKTISLKSYSINMDLAKLLSLKDLKLFLPRFQWNATSRWREVGPISFVSPGGVHTYPELDSTAQVRGFDGIKNSITWSDPTFGGVFPRFSSSLAVMEFFNESVIGDDKATMLAIVGPFIPF